MKLYRIISENGTQATLVALDETERVDVHEATPWLTADGPTGVVRRYYRAADAPRTFIRYGFNGDNGIEPDYTMRECDKRV